MVINSLCQIAAVGNAKCKCPNHSMFQPLDVVLINSFSLPLVGLALQLHRERNNVGIAFTVIIGPDDLFPTHRALGSAFSGLRTLIFTGYQGFHETCMAEQVTLNREQISSYRGEIFNVMTYHSVSLLDLSCSPYR